MRAEEGAPAPGADLPAAGAGHAACCGLGPLRSHGFAGLAVRAEEDVYRRMITQNSFFHDFADDCSRILQERSTVKKQKVTATS